MGGIEGLNAGDPGVALLADAVRTVAPQKLWLVHCGALPGVGPGAQRLIVDIRERVDATAELLEERLGPIALPRRASHAVVWPRAHLGKDFSHWCIARAGDGIEEGGTVWCAARKAKGAKGLGDAMRTLVGPTEVVARNKGYRLMRAIRRGDRTAARADVLARRYRITDAECLAGLELSSAPGVFSRRALDAGTAALLRYVEATEIAAPSHVIDLGTGVGPIAIFAARRWPAAAVTAVDSNVLAVSLARENARACGVAERLTVLASDGMPADPAHGMAELALVNPPTHADRATQARLWVGLRRWLAPSARLICVAARAGGIVDALGSLGASIRQTKQPGYTIVDAQWHARGGS